MKYTYRVQNLKPGGDATVEYVHATLGSVTKHMVLPLDRGNDAIRRKIIEQFPIDRFYSNWLRANPAESSMALTGDFEIDFEDYFYDVQEMSCDVKS